MALNTLDPFNKKPAKKKSGYKPGNFIETLKDIGTSIKNQTKDAVTGGAKDAIDQIQGSDASSGSTETSSPENFNFEDFLKSREKQIQYIERRTAQKRVEQEQLIFNRKEEETQEQIKMLAEEIKKLALETKGLDLEIEKAATAAFVDPGAYHLSFIERIRRVVLLARKRIAESRTWLEAWNQRAQKRAYYWFAFKKGGTKFSLSAERYVTAKG